MKPDRFYAILLRLYPSAFREEYEREMRAAFRRRRRDESGVARRALLWLSVVGDTLATAPGEHFNMLLSEIRYTLRGLRKTPAFAAAVITTMALGIGATTAIYSLVYAVLLRPLPFTAPDRLVRISETNKLLDISDFSASVLNFLSWEEQSRSFEALAAIRNGSANLTGDGEPQRVLGIAVSDHFWTTTGIKPVAGRAFTPEENIPGKDRVVMLSEGLWRQLYGADPEIIGRAVLVNSIPRVVVGIAPDDIGYTTRVDLWTPLAAIPAEEDRANHVITVLGRLRSGVSLVAADAELNAVALRLEKEFPKSNEGWRVRLTPVKEWIVDDNSRTSLYLLLAAVGLLLLTTSANVACLLVARATARAHEFGIRLALGAGRGRLIRQLTTESLVLSVIGGGLGLLVAAGTVRWLATRVTNQLPRSAHLALDWPVLAFAFGLTAGVGFAVGLAPSWSARRADVLTTLRRGGRGTTGSAGVRLRLALAGGQVAVATMLVVGALLLIQSFARLQEVDLGFKPDHLLTASINLPRAKYATQEKAEAFYKSVLSEIEALPGAVSVGVTSGIPMAGGDTSMPIVPVERPASVPERGIQASFRMANAGYLRTMGVPLRRGNLFDESDSKHQTIVLSEGLVRRLWPDGSDPVARQVRLGNGQVLTVVGVVGDVRLTDRREEPELAYYFRPFFLSTLTLVVRTATDPANFVGAIREAVKRIDPAQPLSSIRTMDAVLDANAEKSRLQTTLLTAFACLALLLGAVGIAGVVAYSVERRAPDLAVRLALGATPAAAIRNAAGGGVTASLIGLVLGLLGAWGLSRSFSGVLYKVQPDDPATFAGVGLALLAVAIVACWLPARAAARIDPAAALKRE
ncbi:MAG TPA: ABC transporter permease [Terriglobia bacterium]|nr:ABC transporter permease [Terriglobia bacterium]